MVEDNSCIRDIKKWINEPDKYFVIYDCKKDCIHLNGQNQLFSKYTYTKNNSVDISKIEAQE